MSISSVNGAFQCTTTTTTTTTFNSLFEVSKNKAPNHTELDMYGANLDSVISLVYSGIVYDHVQVLDLSYTKIDIFPDLTCFPKLRVLRCIGTRIKFINISLPPTLQFLYLDRTPIRYIGDHHVPKKCLSITKCDQLIRFPLGKCIEDLSVKWYNVKAPPVRIEKQKVEEMAAKRIVQFLQMVRLKLRMIRKCARHYDIYGTYVSLI